MPFVPDQPTQAVRGRFVPEEESLSSGVLSEGGKGLLRGASDLALGVQKTVGSALLGPIGGPLSSKGVESLAAPSRELIKATPATEAGKFAGTTGEIMGAGAVSGGMGSLRAVGGNILAGLGGATGEQMGGDVGRVVGTLAPGVSGAGLAAAKTRLASKTQPVLEAYKRAGAEASAGQATENVFLHGLENLASKFPGGSGVMKVFIDKQQKDIGRLARTGIPAEAAGRAIETGITGKTGFISRTKDIWKSLDDAVAAKIPRNAEIAPVNTLKALDEMISPAKGAAETSRVLTNPKLQQIYDAFKKDMAPPIVPLPGREVPPLYKTLDKNVIEQPQSGIQKTIETAASELFPHGYGQPSPPVSFPQTNVSGKTTLPYHTLRELRSKVGSMLDDALVSGVPGGQLKKLYGALSEDLKAAANASGAGKEFARQNAYYSARMDRVEGVLDRVIGKNKQPEEIFKAVNPTDPDQANKLRSVMRSLEPAERKTVSDAIVNRLGRAAPGRQDELGELFSSETFLTNWNKLSPGAKSQLFPDMQMRQDMEAIARVSATLREGKGIYSNPSGTAGSFAAYAIYMGPITAIGYGLGAVPGAIISSASAAGSAYLGAKMLTSPAVVKWLATPIKPNALDASAHLSRLYSIYRSSDNELKGELAKFIQSMNPAGDAGVAAGTIQE